MKYEIIEVEAQYEIEQLGTKEKFWIYIDDKKYLFKIGRENTRENLAEKIIYEIGNLIKLNVVKYDFAKYNTKLGVLSPLFLKEDERLVHGNELLAKVIKNYPTEQFYKVREYKLSTVIALINKLSAKFNKDFLHDFIGYLVFDCLTGNQDRHHENWGFVVSSFRQNISLAPSYDHASGLGCRVSIQEIKKRLTTKDKRYTIEAFCNRAKTPFYLDKKRLSTIDAVKYCMNIKKDKKKVFYWIEKILALDFAKVDNILNSIPEEFFEDLIELDFCKKILEMNKNRLEKLLLEEVK